MTEKLFLLLVLVFFILAFGVKNILTYFDTKAPIRGKSAKVTLSIILSTLIYLLIIGRILFIKPEWILEWGLINTPFLNYTGYVLITLGFAIGISALISMRSSWRVGIRYEQKTNLITSGIYRWSRNPYFFSYDILILGYILLFTSPILIVLYLALVITFHKMILEEEKYLKKVHGEEYINYQKRTGRYLFV